MGPRPFSRRDPSCDATNIAHTKLQWGRDLSVAETTLMEAVQKFDSEASMGPRPFSRRDSLFDAITVNIMLDAERLTRSLIGTEKLLVV